MEDPNDLTARLKATSRAVLPDDVRATHLRNIRDELEPSAEDVSDAWSAQRTLVLSAAALVLLLGSAATLIMANRSMPDDGLYGTKLAMEAVVGIVDSDFAASHRLDELEVYIERRAEPSVVLAAQARVASSLEAFADDHDLYRRRRQLVLGIDSFPDPIEVEIDWARGGSFSSSLTDGQLVFVERRVDGGGSTRYEITVTGPWEFTENEAVWTLNTSNPRTTDGEHPTIGILANSDGVTILTGMTDGPESSPITAATTTSQPPTTESAAQPAETTATSASTSTTPTTVAPVATGTVATTATTAQPTTTAAATTAPTEPTTTTTTTPTTTTKPTPTTKPTTTTRPTTTTTTAPTTTTTAPTTTTTAPTTTTTTAPTTTTRPPGDDDDD